MKAFTNDLYTEMTEELKQISLTSDNILQCAIESYQAIDHALEKLKEFVISYTFKDEQEEITFFKEIKPRFQKEYIYHEEVANLESFVPPVAPKDAIVYYEYALGRIDLHFKRYNAIYSYYRTENRKNDAQYFVRGRSGKDLISPISSSDIDQRFSTAYSFQFAKLQAYEKFSTYLQQRIYFLEHPEAAQTDENGSQAIWTDTKVDLIEVGYGLFAKGSINQGKASLKLIMNLLSKAFNVDLGNYYAVIQQNIRLRKRKERTHYLNSMIEETERKMDHLDDNPLRD